MTIDEINARMDTLKIKVGKLAEDLGVNVNSLRQILAGQRPLTEQLSRHIARILWPQECIIVYRVKVGEKKVEELTAGKGCATDALRVQAMQGIIAHNMKQLAELGAKAGWTPEQLAAWGVEQPERLSIQAMPMPGQRPMVAGRAD